MLLVKMAVQNVAFSTVYFGFSDRVQKYYPRNLNNITENSFKKYKSI